MQVSKYIVGYHWCNIFPISSEYFWKHFTNHLWSIMGRVLEKSHKHCDHMTSHRNEDTASSHVFLLDVFCVYLYFWLIFFLHLLSPPTLYRVCSWWHIFHISPKITEHPDWGLRFWRRNRARPGVLVLEMDESLTPSSEKSAVEFKLRIVWDESFLKGEDLLTWEEGNMLS